jgi:hypothetical protein
MMAEVGVVCVYIVGTCLYRSVQYEKSEMGWLVGWLAMVLCPMDGYSAL